MKPLRLLDLFSGIGGFSLGLERSGSFRTVAFCEIEPYCRRVLAKHWPEVPCYDDVQTLTANKLLGDGIEVDAICGGFPCQDVSNAGKRRGITGERSGLWIHYSRLIDEIRPRCVIVENVSALLGRELGDVLGSLAMIGYDAEWHCILASHIGAPHDRDRIWIVAYPSEVRFDSRGTEQPLQGIGLAGTIRMVNRSWATEPGMERVAYGVSDWVDRTAALGNAVVPQIPEMIGRAIMESLK